MGRNSSCGSSLRRRRPTSTSLTLLSRSKSWSYRRSVNSVLEITSPARSIRCSRMRYSNVVSSTAARSEEHTSELQSQSNLVCRLLLEKKKINIIILDFACEALLIEQNLIKQANLRFTVVLVYDPTYPCSTLRLLRDIPLTSIDLVRAS